MESKNPQMAEPSGSSGLASPDVVLKEFYTARFHIITAPHRNVCLGCASLPVAVSFVKSSATPYCFVADSAFLFPSPCSSLCLHGDIFFLVCTFQHFEMPNMCASLYPLPLTTEFQLQLCRSERWRKLAKSLTQTLVWSPRRPRIQIHFLHQHAWSRAFWEERSDLLF